MNAFDRILRSAVLLLVVGTVSVADWAFYVRAAKAQDLQRRLYEDKEQFNQLSGAARSLLERRYGKRQDKEWLRSCGIRGSWGSQRPSVASYGKVPGTKEGVTAPGCR